MKKYIVFALICSIAFAAFTGCNSKSKTDNTTDEKTVKTEVKGEAPKKKYIKLAEKANASMPMVLPGNIRMDRAEAYAMLGLPVGASRAEVQAAYRRLIQRLHPDQGGSAYLAACLNRARDLLRANFGQKKDDDISD